jgi:hypothetical protein
MEEDGMARSDAYIDHRTRVPLFSACSKDEPGPSSTPPGPKRLG